MQPLTTTNHDNELRKSTFCGLTATFPPTPDPQQYSTLADLLKSYIQHDNTPTADDYKEAELVALRQVQANCFAEELLCLRSNKPLPKNSRLLCLAPEFFNLSELIRVGGCLCRYIEPEEDAIHPIVPDPHHSITRLIIKDYDHQLHHSGPERVFAELRRKSQPPFRLPTLPPQISFHHEISWFDVMQGSFSNFALSSFYLHRDIRQQRIHLFAVTCHAHTILLMAAVVYPHLSPYKLVYQREFRMDSGLP